MRVSSRPSQESAASTQPPRQRLPSAACPRPASETLRQMTACTATTPRTRLPTSTTPTIHHAVPVPNRTMSASRPAVRMSATDKV